MRHHSFDQRLCEFAHPLRGGAKFPELIDLLRPFAALEITPEMILNRSFPRSATFTHRSSTTKFRQNVRDFHRCARGFGSAVDFIFKTTCPCLVFVVKTEYYVDYRQAMLYGDTLQSITNGATQVLCVIGFALQNHSASDDCVGFVLDRNFARDQRNLERTRDAMDQNRTVWGKRAQLLDNVIYEPIHVLRIKPARDDVERAFGFGDWRTRRCRFRHRNSDFKFDRAAIGNHNKCPSFVFFVSRYFSLWGLASVRIGTCSIISKP